MDRENPIKENLTQGKVSRVLLQFAVPLLLTNILQQLYHIVDSIIVGHYVGKEALAAVVASYPLFYLLISIVIGIGGGISILVANYFGANQYKQVQRISATYFIFLFGIGLLIAFLGVMLGDDIFYWIGTPKEVFLDAVSYFRIYIIGTFFYIAFNGFISVLRGVGDSVTPFYLMLFSVVLNLFLDILLVVWFDFGVEGAAFATLIAQTTAFFLSFYYLNHNHPIISFTRETFTFDFSLFAQGMRLGIPSGIQQSSISLGLVALMVVVNGFGTDMLTAYGVVGKIETVISQPMLTLGSALAAFVGQNTGANLLHRSMKGLAVSMWWALLLSLFVLVLACCFKEEAIALFTEEYSVIEIGSTYLIILFPFYFLNSFVCVMNGFLRGMGDTLFPMLVSIFSLWFVRLPIAYYGSISWGENAIWWSIVFSWFVAFVVTLLYYYTNLWKKKKIVLLDSKE